MKHPECQPQRAVSFAAMSIFSAWQKRRAQRVRYLPELGWISNGTIGWVPDDDTTRPNRTM